MGARPGAGAPQQPGKLARGFRDALLAFAEAEFRLGRRRKDGRTHREHLEAAARQLAARGRPPPRGLAAVPPLPPGAKLLWGWFLDLHAHRRRTDWGDPVPLDHAALLAWRTLMGVPLPPPDAALILELDRLWRRIDAEAATQPAPADDEDF